MATKGRVKALNPMLKAQNDVLIGVSFGIQ
jgi:hypothetical protein